MENRELLIGWRSTGLGIGVTGLSTQSYVDSESEDDGEQQPLTALSSATAAKAPANDAMDGEGVVDPKAQAHSRSKVLVMRVLCSGGPF